MRLGILLLFLVVLVACASQLTITVGTGNAGAGDSLYSALNKVNTNFTELYSLQAVAQTNLNFDPTQFGTSSGTNVSIKKAAALTNLVLFTSGSGPGLGLAAGASITLTNGNITVKSNGIVTIGDATGAAQLRFQVGAYASDYTGSEIWNFKTASSGGSDGSTVVRLADLTNTTVVRLVGSETLDFASTSAQTSSDLTINVPGAALNDPVCLGVPNGSVLANTSYSAWVSATDTVTVRFLNASASPKDPASGTFRVILPR